MFQNSRSMTRMVTIIQQSKENHQSGNNSENKMENLDNSWLCF